MINLSSIEIANKNLVVRVDMNVPIQNGTILDTTRIEACMPTINYALENNAKVLLISHLGRPTEGNFEERFSLKPVAQYLAKITNEPVKLIVFCVFSWSFLNIKNRIAFAPRSLLTFTIERNSLKSSCKLKS